MRPIMYFLVAAALALSSTAMVACASPDANLQARSNEKKEEIDVHTTSKFATEFFKLAAAKPYENIVISPYSVSTALSMALNGASGATKKQMQKVLGYDTMSDTAINEQVEALGRSLKQVNPDSEFTVANAMFAKQTYNFNKTFIDTNQKYFGAKLETMNFSEPSAINTINGWVKENTRGKIPTILDSIPANAVLYLVNAVYFKGGWLDEFDKGATQPAQFHLQNGSTRNLQMMNRQDRMQYFKGKNFQAVALPYRDKRLEMCIFLPDGKADDNKSLAAFVASLSEANWKEWRDSFGRKEGHLGLPRFKVEYKTELSELLKEAGMPCAFESSCADFKKMIKENAMISRVLHKTYLEVNEKGTEAAAATALEMSVTSAAARPEPPFEMVCDKPFVVVIRDTKTEAVLFMGAIVDPPAAD